MTARMRTAQYFLEARQVCRPGGEAAGAAVSPRPDAASLRAYAQDVLAMVKNANAPAGEFRSARIHLMCYALELALKAYLSMHGQPAESSRPAATANDLGALLSRADALGLKDLVRLTPSQRSQIRSAAASYCAEAMEEPGREQACRGRRERADADASIVRSATNHLRPPRGQTSPIAIAKGGIAMGAAQPAVSRQDIRLSERGQPMLAVQVQRPGRLASAARASGDVVYVHGATFGASLSIFYRFDGRSWADAVNDIGLAVWGFDFPGYGRSERYPADPERPAGRIGDALAQLKRVVAAVRGRNGDRPVCLVAHSWGGAVAAHYAGLYPQDVKALVLFAPIVARAPRAGTAPAAAAPPYVPVTLWAQYRRFVEDVPRGEPQVLGESHFEAWGAAWLATDPLAGTRVPPSVATPSGPLADIGALWSGQELYDPSLVVAPTLLARGEWDSLCTDADAQRLLSALGAAVREDAKIERATHLMHLEAQRALLHDRVNRFLERTAQ